MRIEIGETKCGITNNGTTTIYVKNASTTLSEIPSIVLEYCKIHYPEKYKELCEEMKSKC